jgi:hypothetical protein
MNSYQLTLALLDDKYTKNYFVGVFARDELPIRVRIPSCFIINTHNRNQPGEHWLAIFLNKDGSVEFFDSMGLPPSFYKLDKYLETISNNKIRYSTKRLQGFFSNYCGVYCLYFLYQRSRGVLFEDIINQFKDINNNDKLIQKFIKYFIK